MSKTMSFLALLFFFGALLGSIDATDHQVGGQHGWNLPPTQAFFSEWARNKTFFVNDKLIIKSRSNETHDIAQPQSEADYDGCIQPNFVTDFIGFIALNRPGRRYFMSTMGNDCQQGMKFAIDVLPKLTT